MRSERIALVLATALLGLSACKSAAVEETTEPEQEDWMPDESLEPEATPVATVAPETQAPAMSEEEALEKAKQTYVAAEGLASEGQWTAALSLYEEAYQLVPGKHGFALKVAKAAEETGDCSKAIVYYDHYVKYAVEDKYAESRASAEAEATKLRADGCQ
ncbi:hypothetical protein [Plesiocystis pacifica]|uniref:hypothetical protein n=1 Tax=Plesiocystis pacifica TaxID=191768 RepID=UPI0012FC1F0C|nr:hypothetical protein [Plesiocystis pacifica]